MAVKKTTTVSMESAESDDERDILSLRKIHMCMCWTSVNPMKYMNIKNKFEMNEFVCVCVWMKCWKKEYGPLHQRRVAEKCHRTVKNDSNNRASVFSYFPNMLLACDAYVFAWVRSCDRHNAF